MKTYKTLLFDIDDTLLDFGASEQAALNRLFEEQGFPLTFEVEKQYRAINQGLWKAFEEGKINRDEVINTRFSRLFHEYGKVVDGALLGGSYSSFLAEGHELVEGALELITSLKSKFDLYIVTNGVSKTQDKRLRASGLHPLFKDIFVSEDTGYQKPMKEFFDYVFDRIPDVDPTQTLIIGDSLSADIRGGYLAGIDTCWFNPKMKTNETGIVPTYEIQKLEELHEIVRPQSVTLG